jgi:1,4-alpha-glucan branching enzyme
MGWMNDILAYIKTDPVYRMHNHNKLTFSMMYAFTENYVLPISHDEVVHGKASLIGKMPGDYWEKFAGVRSFLGYMMSHPGKKLNFMGSEFGQFKEWNYSEGVEFFLKQYPLHEKLALMVKELNELYKSTPAFYEIDDSWAGFEWLAPDDGDRNFIAYQRTDIKGETIVVLINFSGSDFHGYKLGLEKGKYKLVFNSDDERYGGGGTMKKTVFKTEKAYSHGKEHSICFDLPKMTCVYLKKIFNPKGGLFYAKKERMRSNALGGRTGE